MNNQDTNRILLGDANYNTESKYQYNDAFSVINDTFKSIISTNQHILSAIGDNIKTTKDLIEIISKLIEKMSPVEFTPEPFDLESIE